MFTQSILAGVDGTVEVASMDGKMGKEKSLPFAGLSATIDKPALGAGAAILGESGGGILSI
jgi:hypothetical protein